MWHTVQAFLASPTPRNLVASLTIFMKQSLEVTLEHLADEFSRPTSVSGKHNGSGSLTVAHLTKDEDFTMSELQHTLAASHKKGAPG